MPLVTGLGRRAIAEGAVVILLVAAGLWYGTFAADHAAVPPDYHYLSPAIAVAAGKGFHGALPVPGTPLDDFLSRRSMTLAWSEVADMPIGPADRFHETTRYLINVVGYWWRVSGISWTSIGSVGAALHAMTVVGAYALIRLFLPLPLAVAGALWICTSTLQLALVPHVRDYSKGAFIVCVLPLIALLALWPLSRRGRWACAAAAGALIGFGLGFKMDVAIMAPLAVAAIVLLRGTRPWTALAEKAEIVGVLGVALLLAAGPLLYRLSEGGSNSFHVILLGFTDGFDANLGIERSVYAFLPFYNDGYVANVIQGHSRAVLDFPSRAYDAAGQNLFLEMFRVFPADLFVRALGAANAVMNLCFMNRDPSFLTQPLPAQPFFLGLYAALYRLNGLGVVIAPLFVLIASWNHLRRGVLAALVLLVLAGYPSLQFESRHYFHAQIVPVVALLVVAWAIVRGGMALARRRAGNPAWTRAVVAAAAIMAGLTMVPLAALRAVQGAQVSRAFTTYLDTRVPLQTETVEEANGSALVHWPLPPMADAIGALRAAHYVAEFTDAGGGAPIHVGVRYDGAAVGQDYSRLLTLVPAAGANRIGFSVFMVDGQSAFAGIELGESARQRLAGVFRVATGGPAGLPLDVRLPADWRERPLYQRLRLERDLPLAMAPQPVTCANGPGCRGLIGYLDRLPGTELPISREGIDQLHSAIVRSEGARLLIDGAVENESSYLFQLKEHTIARGVLVVAGHLHEGGMAIGLLKNRAWYRQAIVQTPGPFVAIIPVDEPGAYTPLVTNAMPPGMRSNHAVITKAGFMEPR